MREPVPFEELVERQVGSDLPYDKPLVHIEMGMRNGSTRREGPYSRWVAELIVGGGGLSHGDVATAVIRPIPTFSDFYED